MTTSPPFSMLLPVYAGDSPEFFRRAFSSSVEHQTRAPDEVVIIQDGPVSAAIAAVIHDLASGSPVPVLHVVLEENRGLAHALTVGLSHCTHDIVARMDADDVSEPQRFAVQLDVVAQGYELVGSGMTEFSLSDDGTEVLGRRRRPPLRPGDIAKYARFHDPFNHPTVVYSKAAVERAGGYLALGLMEDYWLFARMVAEGARVANVPDALVRYRISSGAYQRRGGLALLSSEWHLQKAFLRSRFTSPLQFVRNVLLRGGYRLVPERIRRVAYRLVVLRPRASTEPRSGAIG